MKPDIEAVGKLVVSAAYRLGKELGPGLSENVYETVLARDLVRTGLDVERQKYVSFDYDGLWFENALRLDLLVENCVIVEIKSATQFTPRDFKQLLTYLRLTDTRLGFLLNFGGSDLKSGIRRMVNGL